VTKRIAEVSAQQGVVRARADAEIAALQVQVDTLLEIDAALKKEPDLEVLYLKAIGLKLGLPQE
jgi:hypothetical protein